MSMADDVFVRLRGFGFDSNWRASFEALDLDGCAPARVVSDGRDAWRVATAAGELLARVAGRLRHDGADPPVAGDWVALEARPAEGSGTIHAVLPRRTRIARRAAGRDAREQVVAANVDVVFVVSALDRELNARRIERFLALVYESGALPVLVLNKSDRLAEGLADPAAVEAIAAGVPVLRVSALSGDGVAALEAHLAPGKTAALIGSSGVGKSTLVNRLAGADLLSTAPVREDDDRGRHATTARRIVRLPSGALLLDTPGLREVGLAGGAESLSRVFEDVAEIAASCRFRDCRHEGEPGCAVRAAVESGRLDPDRFESYRKLEREAAYEVRRSDPLARAEELKRWKVLFREYRRRQGGGRGSGDSRE